MIEPERVILFRVPWVDDSGQVIEGEPVGDPSLDVNVSVHGDDGELHPVQLTWVPEEQRFVALQSGRSLPADPP